MTKSKCGRWHCGYCNAKFDSRIDLIIHEEQTHLATEIEEPSE